MTKYETAEAWALGLTGLAIGVAKEVAPKTPLKTWLGIGAIVLAHDVFCPEGQTLSEGVDRAIEKHPVLTLGAIAVTGAHLANILPEAIDPFHQAVKLVKR